MIAGMILMLLIICALCWLVVSAWDQNQKLRDENAELRHRILTEAIK